MIKPTRGGSIPPPQEPQAQERLWLEMPSGACAYVREWLRRILDREYRLRLLFHDLPLLFDLRRLEDASRPYLTEAQGAQVAHMPTEALLAFLRPGLSRRAARIAKAIPQRYSAIALPMSAAPRYGGEPHQGKDALLFLCQKLWEDNLP